MRRTRVVRTTSPVGAEAAAIAEGRRATTSGSLARAEGPPIAVERLGALIPGIVIRLERRLGAIPRCARFAVVGALLAVERSLGLMAVGAVERPLRLGARTVESPRSARSVERTIPAGPWASVPRATRPWAARPWAAGAGVALSRSVEASGATWPIERAWPVSAWSFRLQAIEAPRAVHAGLVGSWIRRGSTRRGPRTVEATRATLSRTTGSWSRALPVARPLRSPWAGRPTPLLTIPVATSPTLSISHVGPPLCGASVGRPACLPP